MANRYYHAYKYVNATNIPIEIYPDPRNPNHICYYSPANNIYVNNNASLMFKELNNLRYVEATGMNWDLAENCTETFSYCPNLTQNSTNANRNTSLVVGANVNLATNMFENCYNFNAPVVFNSGNSNNGISTESMFVNCTNYNQPVTIQGRSEVRAVNMFRDCTGFDQSVAIDNITNATRMFLNCTSITTAPTLTGQKCNAFQGFMRNCRSFNSSIDLSSAADPSKQIYIHRAFQDCVNFNSDITFPLHPYGSDVLYNTKFDRDFNITLGFGDTYIKDGMAVELGLSKYTKTGTFVIDNTVDSSGDIVITIVTPEGIVINEYIGVVDKLNGLIGGFGVSYSAYANSPAEAVWHEGAYTDTWLEVADSGLSGLPEARTKIRVLDQSGSLKNMYETWFGKNQNVPQNQAWVFAQVNESWNGTSGSHSYIPYFWATTAIKTWFIGGNVNAYWYDYPSLPT